MNKRIATSPSTAELGFADAVCIALKLIIF